MSLGCHPPNIPGAFPPFAHFPFSPGQLFSHTWSSSHRILLNVSCPLGLVPDIKGAPRKNHTSSALKALPPFDRQVAGRPGGIPQLPSPQPSPTGHLAPLPCFDVLAGCSVSPARCLGGLPPRHPCTAARVLCAGVSGGRERGMCTTGTQGGKCWEGNQQRREE